MAAPGTVWADDTWDVDAWADDTWADAVESALAFVQDLNTRLLVYLQDLYSTSNPDLNTLVQRRLRELTGDFNNRFNKLIKDATDAMS